MNKLLKYILIGIGITSLCIASVKADYLDGLQYIRTLSYDNPTYYSNTLSNMGFPDSYGLICFKINSFGGNNRIVISFDTNNNMRFRSESSFLTTLFGCFNYNKAISQNFIVANENGGGLTFNIDLYYLPTANISVISGNPGYTSLQCQTEYNLIPISEVTPNYCALNFGMIDPQECPINSGTGAIVRSNLMINDIPYAQNQNINVFIPDFLAWNISFNDLYTVIEIEGYDADTEYIENVINNEKITPTNEDFTYMLTGLANLFPYLAIAFLMYWLIRQVNKSFK